MPRLIVIRPAETDYHLSGRLLGRCDVDLNDIGREQSHRLARALNRWELASVAVSPLKRAIATAMPLCEDRDLILHPVAGFLAADLGDWEGESVEDLVRMDGSRYDRWLNDPDFRAPGGEALREVYGRAYSDIAHIVQQADHGETLAFVVPLMVLRALCCAALDLPLEAGFRFSMDPAGFGVFERMSPGGPYQMISWNQPYLTAGERETEHYEEELPNV